MGGLAGQPKVTHRWGVGVSKDNSWSHAEHDRRRFEAVRRHFRRPVNIVPGGQSDRESVAVARRATLVKVFVVARTGVLRVRRKSSRLRTASRELFVASESSSPLRTARRTTGRTASVVEASGGRVWVCREVTRHSVLS